MACCKYCSYGKDTTDAESGDTLAYLSVSKFNTENKLLHSELGHMKAKEIAMQEVIRELQERVAQLQDRILELASVVKKINYPVHRTSTPYFPSSQVTSFCHNITQEFLDVDMYAQYLEGDYKNAPNDGFQLDEEIDGLVDVRPKEMQNDVHAEYNSYPGRWNGASGVPQSGANTATWDHLKNDSHGGSPHEKSTRTTERKEVKDIFLSASSGNGVGQIELDQYKQMLNSDDSDEVEFAKEKLRQLYSRGIKGQTSTTEGSTGE